MVTDRAVGGRSEATFEVLVGPTEPVSEQPGHEAPAGANAAAAAEEEEGPIAVFSGQLSTLRPAADPTYACLCSIELKLLNQGRLITNTRSASFPRLQHVHPYSVKRTGYCGVKIELPRPLKVDNYEGLELRVRTDGRNYVTNVEVGLYVERAGKSLVVCEPGSSPTPNPHHDPHPTDHHHTNKPITNNNQQQVSSFFPDELYQGYISGLPGGRWFTLQLPFRDMTLTRLGRLSYVQRDLDGSFTLESIGACVDCGWAGERRWLVVLVFV